MSIKKAISLSFLLLANMVLLAHTLIPHHHHNEIPVILCGNHHEHNSDTGNHHHADTHPISQCADPDNHCQEAIQDCSLTKTFVRIGSNNRQNFQPIDYDVEQLPCLLMLFSVNPIAQITDLKRLSFRQKPHLPLFYTDFVAQSIGLRAPPAC